MVSLAKFVRSTPPAALRAYFRQGTISIPDTFDWSARGSRFVQALVNAVENMDETRIAYIRKDAERISNLSDEAGQAALYSVVPQRESLDLLENGSARALHVLLHDPDAFRRAEEVRYTDSHRRGRMWDGYIAKPGLSLERDTGSVDNFKNEIRQRFRTENVHVDIFDRTRGAASGEAYKLIQVTVYRDGRLDDVLEFAKGDPPYGVSYDPAWRKRAGINLNPRKLGKVANDDQADWREAWALFPGSVAYVWHASLHTSEVKQSLEASGFDMRAQIIWAKDRFAFSRGHYHWQHEPCWYAVRGVSGAHWSGDRKQSTVWTINARDDDGHGHGTQKPVECMRRPIENNSSPGQAIYDPFSGSGTTIIAAEMTGRSCFAIDIDPAYTDVAVLRWQAFTGSTATLQGAGRSFAELAAERQVESAS
jgi:DNA methylase